MVVVVLFVYNLLGTVLVVAFWLASTSLLTTLAVCVSIIEWLEGDVDGSNTSSRQDV